MNTKQPEIQFVNPRRKFAKNMEWNIPFQWLSTGWADLWLFPTVSILYGSSIFLLSVLVIYVLFSINAEYLVFSAFAGFMIIGPALAVGLYEKSRIISENETVSMAKMLSIRGKTLGQILLIGVVLGLIMVMWLRAAFLLYALFFGMVPFSGFDHIVDEIFTTTTGWGLLIIGSAVGGLFASFSFAVSAFSIPMLLDKKVDAFTAMGTSMALAWHNMKVAIVWGFIVLTLFLLCLATGLFGLIIIFPWLGHSTWHAYKQISC